MEDEIYEAEYSISEGFTVVNLRLKPYESVFVIFDGGNSSFHFKNTKKLYIGNFNTEKVIEGEWKVYISTAEEYPKFKRQYQIGKLGNISIPQLLPSFSGTVRYEITFHFDAKDIKDRVLLDMGEVYEIAEVKLNGKWVNTRICPPYTFDVTKYIHEGENMLQMDITNTLAKKHPENEFDRAMPQEPSGLMGPVKLQYNVAE